MKTRLDLEQLPCVFYSRPLIGTAFSCAWLRLPGFHLIRKQETRSKRHDSYEIQSKFSRFTRVHKVKDGILGSFALPCVNDHFSSFEFSHHCSTAITNFDFIHDNPFILINSTLNEPIKTARYRHLSLSGRK